MDQDIKSRWVARLRSGEVEQGQGNLGTADGKRCCLGVLCDLAVEAGVIEPPIFMQDQSRLLYVRSSATLPWKVQEWAGLQTDNPAVEDDRGPAGRLTLTLLNDGSEAQGRRPQSFAVIADLIEGSSL